MQIVAERNSLKPGRDQRHSAVRHPSHCTAGIPKEVRATSGRATSASSTSPPTAPASASTDRLRSSPKSPPPLLPNSTSPTAAQSGRRSKRPTSRPIRSDAAFGLCCRRNCGSDEGGSGFDRSYGRDHGRFVRFQRPPHQLKLVNQFSCTRTAVACPDLSDSHDHWNAAVHLRLQPCEPRWQL